MALDDATRLARAEGILESEIDGEAVMMSIEKGEYYGLDGVGTEIWKLLETPRSFGEICERLQERYEVEPETCRADVGRFLEALLRDGTLRVVEAGSSEEPPTPAPAGAAGG